MSISENILPKAYLNLHRWLVRRTNAYQRLFGKVAETAKQFNIPLEYPALLIPSSTGEPLIMLKEVQSNWYCVDINQDCLEACQQILPQAQTLRTNLNTDWPFTSEQFGLSVSIHALHYLASPNTLVNQLRNTLVPGAISIWVVFQGELGKNKGIVSTLSTIRKEKGIAEMLNFMPWKLADSLMLALSGTQHHFWSQDAFHQFLEQHGLNVELLEAIFNNCSWLAVTSNPTFHHKLKNSHGNS